MLYRSFIRPYALNVGSLFGGPGLWGKSRYTSQCFGIHLILHLWPAAQVFLWYIDHGSPLSNDRLASTQLGLSSFLDATNNLGTKSSSKHRAHTRKDRPTFSYPPLIGSIIFAKFKNICYVGGFGLFSLKVRLDSLVLWVKISHIYYQIFKNEHVAEGGDKWGLIQIRINFSDASQWVEAITVHWAWATDSFSAWSSEWEGGVKVILHINEGIQVHGWDGLEINIVANIFRFVFGVFGIVSIDQESFHLWLLLSCEIWVVLFDIVGI